MKRLSEEIIHFFHRQNFVVVSTVDRDGSPHNACKGIVKIDQEGRVYLLDLYMRKTYENLKENPNLSITAVDEHKFHGYCLKGKADIISRDRLTTDIITAWDKRINSRITHRLLKNIHGEMGHHKHPEAQMPKPAYMIVLDVEEVIDLTPSHIKHV